VKPKEKLAASFLTLVIAISGASIGYSCATFSSRQEPNETVGIFRCICGEMYIFGYKDGELSVVHIETPELDYPQQGNNTDQWL